MAKRDKPLVRPLSPFWQYQFWPNMFLSILHRITGVAMSVGAVLLVYWLTAAAMGADRYVAAQSFFAHWFAQVALIGFLFSFCYHFLNGIRHLVWDTGRGFDVSTAHRSGYVVIVGAIIATALLVLLFFARAGGAV